MNPLYVRAACDGACKKTQPEQEFRHLGRRPRGPWGSTSYPRAGRWRWRCSRHLAVEQKKIKLAQCYVISFPERTQDDTIVFTIFIGY